MTGPLGWLTLPAGAPSPRSPSWHSHLLLRSVRIRCVNYRSCTFPDAIRSPTTLMNQSSPALTAAATIWSPQVNAAILHLPLAEVEATLAEAAGYGTAPYGLGAYGRCKAVAEGDAEVVRRVSLTGQMTCLEGRCTD